MKASITLASGAKLELAAVAGAVEFEIHGLARLSTHETSLLIDLLGCAACMAEDQGVEFNYLAALGAAGLPPPRDLTRAGLVDIEDVPIPAFLRRAT